MAGEFSGKVRRCWLSSLGVILFKLVSRWKFLLYQKSQRERDDDSDVIIGVVVFSHCGCGQGDERSSDKPWLDDEHRYLWFRQFSSVVIYYVSQSSLIIHFFVGFVLVDFHMVGNFYAFDDCQFDIYLLNWDKNCPARNCLCLWVCEFEAKVWVIRGCWYLDCLIWISETEEFGRKYSLSFLYLLLFFILKF